MKHLFVEIANNPIKRECGLMNRKSMGKNNGMLFKFPYSHQLSFWMKNTYIPLNIAYIDDNGKILQIEEMTPLSTRAIVSNNEVRYALEVNKGWFKENKVKVGDYVGGIGFDFTKKAQMTPQDPIIPPDQTQQPQPNPEVMLNKSVEEILEEANKRKQKLTIIYQKEDGYVLPPKTISPPFEIGSFDVENYKRKSDGRSHKEFDCWDEQEGSYKTFFIDGVLNIEFAQKT
jgi:uncharacterized membrane protein (UPF0127 family)